MTTPAPGRESEAGRPAPPAGRRSTAGDAILLAAGVVLTLLFAYGFARKPLPAAAALGLFAVLAALWLGRRRIARWRVGILLVGAVLLLPLLALLGPIVGLPQAPQVFAFRVLLAVTAYFGVTWLLLYRSPLRFAAKELALLIALWFGWLLVGMIWAPDKAAGFRYLAVLLTMMLLLAATAAAGGSRRRLKVLGATLIVAYLAIIGVTILESTLGVHLATSRLTTVVTSQTWAVTSVFHNQNDLATYLAMCWPFMLGAFFFTRKPLWWAASAVFMLLAAAAFVRTGSRSSLVAIGLESLAAIVLFWRFMPSLSSRTGKVVVALIAVILLGGAAYLAFSNSSSDMLRQFRLGQLTGDVQAAKGSGEIRAGLTERGFTIAGSSYLVGAGPGQAEAIIGKGADALSIANLHNWWLETYADGGLPGFLLHLLFFLGLLIALWPIAGRDPDPLVRYLASGTVLALIGFTIGAVGPSSSSTFAPMFILYGLGLAVVSRARLAAASARLPAAEQPEARPDPPAAARAAAAEDA